MHKKASMFFLGGLGIWDKQRSLNATHLGGIKQAANAW